jgi:hypothetical protein
MTDNVEIANLEAAIARLQARRVREEVCNNADRYVWLRKHAPELLCAIAYRVKAACEFRTPDDAIDAAREVLR